jgi:inosine-uridine nucleoside N-ribohydrolase
LGMIHALESRGECKLIAVTITKDHPLAGPFTDAINTFYNRGDIPIGVCRSGVTPDEGKFIGMASQMDGDSSRYPHDLLSGENAPDAVQVLRRALASAEDGTVVIAQVGFSTNLANLMDSKPDEISPLGGLALVQQKVRLLSVMAGAFTQIIGDKGKPYDHQEYNVVQDIPSAKSIATRWPTPILWSGFEIGLALGYPAVSIANDYRYASPHPLKEAYLLYCGPNHDRPTWDLTSVLVAIRPDRQYFDRSPVGTVTVQDNGLTTFEASESGRHQYLVLPENGQKQVLESLMLLSSEPPH